ncbi:GNAT family N-acetyltransferase [Floricoccus penangensis]|uniref:GNAT family N-acetyltransferase n=1 Tax=Floricoccus penangensis TaxID=1859475 RepID=UPI00117EFF90|nr:GNAT family N-acetyltransferase [Floricoccus penangensis]
MNASSIINSSPCLISILINYRSQGIARDLLNFVYQDMLSLDIDILYLITDHVNLYEKLNWNFLAMVRDDDNMLTRMYEYKINTND